MAPPPRAPVAVRCWVWLRLPQAERASGAEEGQGETHAAHDHDPLSVPQRGRGGAGRVVRRAGVAASAGQG